MTILIPLPRLFRKFLLIKLSSFDCEIDFSHTRYYHYSKNGTKSKYARPHFWTENSKKYSYGWINGFIVPKKQTETSNSFSPFLFIYHNAFSSPQSHIALSIGISDLPRSMERKRVATPAYLQPNFITVNVAPIRIVTFPVSCNNANNSVRTEISHFKTRLRPVFHILHYHNIVFRAEIATIALNAARTA